MVARIHSGAIFGVEALPVQVEVEVGLGMPHFQIVGMGDRAVAESRHRIRAALKNSGFDFPARRVTVNLAPADQRKDGSSFDLPIALGLLVVAGVVTAESAASFLVAGELALDGRIRSIPGSLVLASHARDRGLAGVLLPRACAREAAVVDGLAVHGAGSLAELVEHLKGASVLPAVKPPPPVAAGADLDLADVRGQGEARFALEVAAAGGHNLLFVGPPGTGKTLLARRLPSILPDLTLPEALEATRVWSVAGRLRGRGLLRRPPFCAPHHSVSDAGLIGSGTPPAPGEVSLAHRGVLFLDELPEFRRNVLECLREPLEEGEVRIRRAHQSLTYPARFQLVAAMNPCNCGRFSLARPGGCTCGPESVRRYRRKISGPLLDRIDMHVEVPSLPGSDLRGPAGEASSKVRERVMAARERAAHRLQGLKGIGASPVNAAIPAGQVRSACRPAVGAEDHLAQLVLGWELSARSYDRLLRVARTVADLESSDELTMEHVIRASGFRVLDQGLA